MGKNDSVYSIPEGVRIIEQYAFSKCNNLKSVIIPDSVVFIDSSAFSECSGLNNITLPDNVSIGSYAFYYCRSLTSVFYQGSQLVSPNIFGGCYALKLVCVSPDYKNASFGGKDVSDSETCQTFQKLFNQCYKGAYIDGDFIEQKRNNVTYWEDQSSDCVQFYCVNESGLDARSACYSTDTVKICQEGKCVDEDVNINKWVVELELDGTTTVFDFNSEDLKQSVSSLTGVNASGITIGYEMNMTGSILRVLVYVDDGSTANAIYNAVKELKKGEGCPYGVLCRTKTVLVSGGEWLVISSGYRTIVEMVMFIFMLFMIINYSF